MSVSKRPSMGKPYSRAESIQTPLTNWLWDSQAKTTPLMYPLRYSSGELPASGSDSDIPPHVLLNYTGNTVENQSRTLFNIGVKQDLNMITEGLSVQATGSWDSQTLFGESRYSMPALYLARERNQNGERDARSRSPNSRCSTTPRHGTGASSTSTRRSITTAPSATTA